MASTNIDTPMMKQFRQIKEQYPDALLLFRCGDFYETYSEDAIEASRILNITLTRRNNGGSQGNTEMAGFPYHALDTYLPKLIRQGKRVAICDQLEDPKLTKTLVKRGVTELVTPGVSYSDTTLNTKENNFVAAVYMPKKKTEEPYGLSLLDISTGEFLLAEGTAEYVNKLLSNFQPKEVLYERGRKAEFTSLFTNRFFTFELEDWMFTIESATDRLLRQFQTQTLKGFGVDTKKSGIIAAGAIMHYLDLTQHLKTSHIQTISRIEEDRYMWLDNFSMQNLELLGSRHQTGVTLIDVLDRTLTPMGARLLRRWISFPLKNVNEIQKRHDVVDHFFRQPQLRELIAELLPKVGDLERLSSRVATGKASPRELRQLAYSLEAVSEIKQICSAEQQAYLQAISKAISPLADVRKRLLHTIAPDAPALLSKPGYIGQGVDPTLDELRHLQTDGKQFLMQLQAREAEQTGIQSLRIGYNNVFGYYLEVRNTYKELVPPTWIRKQTLANAERYITEELKEYENKIVNAEEQIAVIETRIYNELLMYLSDFVSHIQANAMLVAQVDCLLSFALVAQDNKYVRPDINDSLIIDIHGGRHPVIEKQMPIGEQYVANDVLLDNNTQQIIILTGPNMSGKSALLRQTALICLMAQCGSFVPAESAKIGIVDKIFTRVGASDNISVGESTFMVEMNEAAAILNNISERSLILFDELGRGTSTYDGISIAWAIVEYIHESRFRPKTLFATHYHELNDMEKTMTRIRNYNVSVKEVNNKVIFLRKLARGGSEHSFGIHVAKMAGMPQSIVKRAEKILQELENANREGRQRPTTNIAQGKEGLQLSFFQLDDPVLAQVSDEIKNIDINALTPLEALNKLSEIKKIVTGK